MATQTTPQLETQFKAWLKTMKADLATRSAGRFGKREFADKMFRAYAWVDFSINALTPQQSADKYLIW